MIVAGPYLGEFGWQCAVWAPWLRAMAEGQAMRVLCAPGHEALYDDFSEPTPVSFDLNVTHRLRQNAWVAGKLLKRPDYERLAAPHADGAELLTPADLQFDESHGVVAIGKPCKWHRYGREQERDLVVVHARSVADSYPERNWPAKSWAALCEHLPAGTVAVGSDQGAICPPGCRDLRGIPLRELMDVFARARIVIGPSSGPLHLANLCGARVVWWSKEPRNVLRYRERWNPFGAQNYQAAQSWQPSVQDVAQAALGATGAIAA